MEWNRRRIDKRYLVRARILEGAPPPPPPPAPGESDRRDSVALATRDRAACCVRGQLAGGHGPQTTARADHVENEQRATY